MKVYKTLLFDLDDTLLDFSKTEDKSLQKLFDEYNFTLTPEIKEYYKKLNGQLWHAYELGELSREEVLNSRFSMLFSQYGLEVDGVVLEKSYRNYLAQGHDLIEGALDLIKMLHHQFDLYVVTNGSSDTQYSRLKDSGLSPYFKGVFISEDAGFQKPMKEFFDHVFSNIDGFDYERTMIIGDSLSADITGGWQVGIDTCWVNRNQVKNETDILPTYEIKELTELYQLLNVER